jgi:hypothetical protein
MKIYPYCKMWKSRNGLYISCAAVSFFSSQSEVEITDSKPIRYKTNYVGKVQEFLTLRKCLPQSFGCSRNNHRREKSA